MTEPNTRDFPPGPAERIGEIVLQARNQSTPAARERYLSEVCGDDAELRAQVVSLLEAEAAAGDFLNQTILGDPSDRIAEGPGSRIGPYKLLEKIGEGGFGAVYVAEQDKPLQRRVALKIVKLGMDTRQVVARFEAERQALARMDHPNIAKVFDAGATESGRPYFVMELVRGIKITDYCDRHQLHPQQRLELFKDICHAVQHAHQKGIIHRDLKPSNILVAQHDTAAVPKVIDFGIAKATQGRLTDMTLYTGWTRMIGTPVYMAPEQAEFSGSDVDTRSDIYSLGVLLYELLTGRTPFEQRTVLEAGLDEIRRLIREVEPTRPSTRLGMLTEEELHTVARARNEPSPKLIGLVRGDLDWIVMKCLEKDRSRRYETANGLAQDVGRYLGHEPILARPPSRVYQFRKWARRNKGLFVSGSAVAAGLVIAWGAAVFVAVRERAHSRSLQDSREEIASRSVELQRRLSREYLHRGQALGEAGYVAEGLHWMARAHEELPADTPALKRAIEDNLVAWAREWDEPERLWNLDGAPMCSTMVPGGRGLLMGTSGGTVILWSGDLSRKLWATNVLDGTVWGLAVSPDGERFVVGLYSHPQHKAQVRSVDDGELLGELIGHEEAILNVTFSPDGRRILTGSRDFTARIWSAETFQVSAPPLQHSNWVSSVAFSPDGRIALTGSYDKTARLWSVETGAPLGRPIEHGGEIFTVGFTPDGETILTAGYLEGLRLWSASTGEELQERSFSARRGNGFCFSPDGMRLLAGFSDQSARLWWLSTGELVATMLHAGQVTDISFSPDGRLVLTASRNNAHLWLAETGAPVGIDLPSKTWYGLPGAGFTPDGRAVTTWLDNRLLAVWPLRTELRRSYYKDFGFSRFVALAPDGRTFVQSWNDGEMNFVDVTTGERVGTKIRHGTRSGPMVYSPDGTRLLSGGDDGFARLWDTETHKPLAVSLQHSNTVTAVDWSRKGDLIATGSRDQTAAVWSTDGQLRHGPFRHGAAVVGVHFSSDGKYLLTACADDVARLWDMSAGAVRQSFEHRLLSVVDISPDGRWVITGGTRNTAKIWDVETGEPTGVEVAHRDAINDVTFHPSGEWFLTTSDDHTARLWSRATGEQIGPILEHDGHVYQGAFTPGGDQVILGTREDAVLWSIGSVAPPEIMPDPRLWVETVTHATMGEDGRLQWLGDEEVEARKERLREVEEGHGGSAR